jgi:hypothetical protein
MKFLKILVFTKLELFPSNPLNTFFTLESPLTGSVYKFVCNEIKYTGTDITTVVASEIVFGFHIKGYDKLFVPSKEVYEFDAIRKKNMDDNIPILTSLVDDMENQKLEK